MNTSFLAPYISDNTIKAISWTMIHSLWIGLVIALLTGLLITFSRKATADLRYRLLCGLLVIFIIAVGITFYIELGKSTGVNEGTATTITNNHPVKAIVAPANFIPAQQRLVSKVTAFIDRQLDVLFLIWLLFFAMKSLKMMGGLWYIQRIRRRKISAVGKDIKLKLTLFAERMGIKRKVDLLYSELVKVPVAVGWLKPVILLPAGIFLQLTPEQIDSVLLHELAHIRRRDYLVNMLQGLAEAVFFFNPALLWLSSLIRAEREACCDDMVLCRTSRKANYLEALLAFGMMNGNQTNLAMSLGSGNELKNRLKRMVNQENEKLSITERAVLITGLLLLTIFTILPKADQAAKHIARGFVNSFVPSTKKAVDAASASENRKASANLRKRKEVDTTSKRDTVIRFTSVLFKQNDADIANADMSAMDDKGNIYHLIVADNKLTSLEINNIKVIDSQLPGYEYMVRQIDRELAMKKRVREQDNAGLKATSPAAKFKGTVPPADQPFVKKWRTGDPEPKFMMAGAKPVKKYHDNTEITADQQRARGVIAALVSEKIIASPAELQWFGLSDTELVVNGQKQPEALHQKLKEQYGIKPQYGLYYGPVKMYGTGVFLDRGDL